jgi:hypothetical protein
MPLLIMGVQHIGIVEKIGTPKNVSEDIVECPISRPLGISLQDFSRQPSFTLEAAQDFVLPPFASALTAASRAPCTARSLSESLLVLNNPFGE